MADVPAEAAPIPADAGSVVDCGFVAGERYWITRRGIVFPNGDTLEDSTGCTIPVGVILAIRWGETPGYVIETHAACKGATDEAAEIAALVERARAVLAARGADPTTIYVEDGACADRRRVDISATGG